MRRLERFTFLLLIFALARGVLPRRRTPTPGALPLTESVVAVDPHAHGYDLRVGAATYAPIIGAIGGFVVTAVVLVFEIASSHHASAGVANDAALGRATSMLVLGLIACLLSAFAFGAIGAERKLTPNLTAGVIYAGATTAIGATAIIAAFEVLASVYLPETKDLFVWITTGAAIAGSVLVSLALGDAWLSAPKGHWLHEPGHAARWASLASGAIVVVLLAGTLLYFEGVRLSVGTEGVHWFVGIGIVLVLCGGLGSMFRTIHRDDSEGGALRKGETFAVLGVLVAYLLTLLLLIP